jgi:peptidoglycan hydrolase-like protein with peptidoglycan-binding domain
MCGTPVGAAVPDGAMALPGRTGGYESGYGTPQAAAPGGEGTQMLAAPAGYGYPPAGYGPDPQAAGYAQQAPGYGPEPTQAPAGTPTEFESLFRSADGSPGAHGQTQLLPPVEADYRAPAPGAAHRPPDGGSGGARHDEDDARSNRPMILVTVGAVVVAAGLILGLLYLGNQGGSSGDTAATSTASASASASTAAASQGGSAISIPTDGATLRPTATASASASAAGGFHGDNLPLGPGSSGSTVKWVQDKLRQLGYFHDNVSGDFDQATALAVQRFQAAAGVTGDAASTVGTHTIVALAAAGTTPDLHTGSKSSAVSRLNTALTYATGTHLSGSRYTSATTAVVLEYQQAVGITPTGQVNAATWAKLQDGTLANG